MKKHLQFKSLLLLCALIVGSSSVWAQTNERTITIDYNDTFSPALPSSTGNSSATAHTVVGLAIKEQGIYKGSSNNYLMFVSGKGFLYNTADLGTVNSVAVTYSGGTSTTGKSGVYFGTSEQSTYTTTSNATIKGQSKTDTWTNSTSGKGFFQLSTSNKNVQITQIVIKYTPPVAPTFDISAGTFNAAFNLTISAATGRTLKYTIDGSDPYSSNTATSVNSNTTTISIPAENTRVRAISIKDNITSLEADATYTYVDASAPDAALSTTALDFDEVEVNHSKELTFTVTPANLSSALYISCDNNKYAVSPTSIAQDAIGSQTITVTAAPTAWNNDMDGTITISGGGLTVNKTVTLSTSPYQVSTVTLTATNGVIQQSGVTKTSITSRVGNTVTVTAIPNDGYLFNSWTAVGATPASSETAETEFTFTATSVTLTANFVVDNREFVTLEESDIANMTGSTGYGNVKTITKNGLTWSTTGYKQNATDKYIQLKAGSPYPYVKIPELPGAIQTITFSVTNTSASAKDGAKTDGTLRFRTINSNSATNIVSGGGSSTNEIVLDFTALDQKYSTGYIFLSGSGARIWDITVAYIPAEDYDINFTDTKYATFCDYVARDFSGTGLKAYKAKVNEGKVALTEISNGKVPANTGVILYGAEGNYTVPVIASADAVSDNELIGVNTRTLVEWTTGGDGKKNYILQGGVFKKAAAGGHLKANRAYLHTSYDVTAGARDYLEFAFEDEPTVIETVKVENAHNEYFNLAGQRVAQPTKGLYIVNGRKVVVK